MLSRVFLRRGTFNLILPNFSFCWWKGERRRYLVGLITAGTAMHATILWQQVEGWAHTQTEREKGRGRGRDKQREREGEGETNSEREGETNREREGERERQTEKERESLGKPCLLFYAERLNVLAAATVSSATTPPASASPASSADFNKF